MASSVVETYVNMDITITQSLKGKRRICCISRTFDEIDMDWKGQELT